MTIHSITAAMFAVESPADDEHSTPLATSWHEWFSFWQRANGRPTF